MDCKNLTEALNFICVKHAEERQEILLNSTRLTGFIGDLLPDAKREKFILKGIFENKIPEKLVAALEKGSQEQQMLMRWYVGIIVDNTGIAQDIAEDVLWPYAEALGWAKRPKQIPPIPSEILSRCNHIMKIEKAFVVTGRGVAVYGSMEKGCIHLHHRVEIVDIYDSATESYDIRGTVVTGIDTGDKGSDTFRQSLPEAKAGDYAALLLRGISLCDLKDDDGIMLAHYIVME